MQGPFRAPVWFPGVPRTSGEGVVLAPMKAMAVQGRSVGPRTVGWAHRLGARLRAVLLAGPLGLALGTVLPAAAQPPGFQHQVVVDGLYSPTSIAMLPDDRLLITLKSGLLLISGPVNQPPVTVSPYMNLSGSTDGSAEHGVIEVLLDPQFADNGHLYVFYSHASGRNRVSRFSHLGNQALPSSEFVVWEAPEPYINCCHTGGAMAFMDDSTIVLAVGDDFRPQLAQAPTNGHGKVHRFRKDGSIPADNPFQDGSPGPYNASGAVQSIHALGLRNPFRGGWDGPTGRFLVGEVGGNDHSVAWEDLHLVEAGANFGWPDCGDLGRLPNGECQDAQFDDPVHAYPHAGSGASVTGGTFYRGAQFPPEWQGRYFYGDYARGWIRYLEFDAQGQVADEGPFLDTAAYGGVPATSVVKLLEGGDGSLFYVSITDDYQNFTGSVHRISSLQDMAPVCGTLQAAPAAGPGPDLEVTLTADASDPEGSELSFIWDLGDGSPQVMGDTVLHTYMAPGYYMPGVLVSDGVNTVDCGSIGVAVGTPPTAEISSPADSTFFQAGTVVTFTGSGSDDGPLPLSAYSWTAVFNHDDHIHPESGATGTDEFDLVIPATGHGFSGNTWYTVTLTITDDDGLQASSSVRIYPQKVDVTVESVPPGMEVVMDGMPRTTPFVTDQAVGSQVVLSVQNTLQCQGANGYLFSGWSNGLPSTQVYTVPAAPDPLEAFFLLDGPCGYCGTALDLDGVDDLVTLPEFLLSGDLTISCWARPAAGIDSADVLLSDGGDHVLDLHNGHLRLRRTQVLVEGTIPLAPGVWSHVALTRSAGDWRVFINGVEDPLAAEVPDTAPLAFDRVGSRPGQGYFAGGLDELRLWSVCRTPTELQVSMGVLLQPGAQGLLGYWRFDQDPGQQWLPDLGPLARHALRGADALPGPDDPQSSATSGPLRLACERPATLSVKAMLQGPYDGASGLMHDSLRTKGLLPLTEPYTALGWALPGWNGGQVPAGVLGVNGADAVVDWVVVELRDDGSPDSVVRARPALLQRDGDVVDLDGSSPLILSVDAPRFHVAVRHRNHFGVMSAQSLLFGDQPVEVDLSSPQQSCYGLGARALGTQHLLLWAGNALPDDRLKYVGSDNDRDAVLVELGSTIPTAVVGGYLQADLTLDGRVKYTGAANDRDLILSNIGGVTPTFVRIEQLP